MLALAVLAATALGDPARAQNVCGVGDAEATFPLDGEVVSSAPVLRVDLCRATRPALGALVRTYRVLGVGARSAGRLTGVYRIVRVDWPSAEAEAVAVAALPGASGGDGVVIDDVDDSRLRLEVGPDSAAATVLWRGRPLGTAPLDLTLAPGVYDFEVRPSRGSGLDASTLRIDLRTPQVTSTQITLSPRLPCIAAYRSAESAFFSRRAFSEARDAATDALARQSDGTCEVGELRLLHQAATMTAELAERREGLAPDAGSYVHLALKEIAAGRAAAARGAIDALRGLIPNDPLPTALADRVRG